MSTKATSAPGKHKKVLIVDDETDICDIITFDLESKGYQVTQATTGTQAMDAIKTSSFDFVVTDFRMPRFSGLHLLDELRKKSPELPVVVMMTGFSDIDAAEAIARGAYGLINKPFATDSLLEILAQAQAKVYGSAA